MIRSRTPGKTLRLLGSLLALGACAVPVAETEDSETAISAEVMTQLSAMAAPYQDLQSVRLRPEDGCYWYRHVGPVETTMLPLRTADGRQICRPGREAPAGDNWTGAPRPSVCDSG